MTTATTSAARVAANQRNAARSTGPKTAEGKERARANAVKHGLTGAGTVLPGAEAAAFDERFARLRGEMAPATLEAELLVRQIALMSVRIDRAAAHEAAEIDQAVRHAATEFDLAHAAEIDLLFNTIADTPRANHRRLLTSLAGVDRLIVGLASAREQLATGAAKFWKLGTRKQVDAMLGGDYTQFAGSPADRLMEAIFDKNFLYLRPEQYNHLDEGEPRHEWACQTLIDLIDAELDHLRDHRDEMDPAAAAEDADRRGAVARALFLTTPEAILARRYEAASLRALNRARREFRELQPLTTVATTNDPATASPQHSQPGSATGPEPGDAPEATGFEVEIVPPVAPARTPAPPPTPVSVVAPVGSNEPNPARVNVAPAVISDDWGRARGIPVYLGQR